MVTVQRQLRQRLCNMQQNRKQLHDPDYNLILETLDISPQLVASSKGKEIVKPKVA